MKINAALRLNSLAIAMGLVAIVGVGCSGSQQEEVTLEPTEEPAEEKATDEEAADPVEELEEEASVTPEPLPMVEAPAATTAPVSTQASAADKSRVVRYVSQDEVMIHGQPNESAEPVGKLKKGDMIMVVENEGWGKISDNMFIKAEALSNKAVPRNRTPATWGKPTH